MYALEDFRAKRKFQNGSRERSLEAVDLRIRYVGSRIEYICHTLGDFKPETLGPHIICIIISRILKAASKTILLFEVVRGGAIFLSKNYFPISGRLWLSFFWVRGLVRYIYFFLARLTQFFALIMLCRNSYGNCPLQNYKTVLNSVLSWQKLHLSMCRIIFLKENMLWHESHWSVEVIFNDLLSKNHILEVLLTQMTTNFTLLRYHSIVLDLSLVHEKNYMFR